MTRPLHSDAGLQPERTTLAWTRTAASLAAVSVLCMRYVPGSSPVVHVVGGIAIAAAVSVVLTARRRYEKTSSTVERGGTAPPLFLVMTLTAVVVALAGAAAVYTALAA